MSLKILRLLEGLRVYQQIESKQIQYKYISQQKQYTCKFQIWKNQIFQNIYPSLNIKDIYNEFNNYIQLPQQVMGKRSSEIVLSNSRKYCLKIINTEDFETYMSFFQDYLQFIKQRNQNQQYFVQIFRLLKVKSKDSLQHISEEIFILMPCLTRQFQNTLCSYDLKGYAQGRIIDQKDYEDFRYGKDHNFIYSKQLQLIKKFIPEDFKQSFIKIFEQHAQFLHKHELIDYSLLLIFFIKQEQGGAPACNRQLHIKDNIWMKWGIIDYLQLYNTKKVMQNKIKSLFKKDISSVQPKLYMTRFKKFLQLYLK